MTDLVIAVRLKADGSGLVGQLSEVKAEVVGVGQAAGAAATPTRQLERATEDLGNAQQRQASAARSTVNANQQAAASIGQVRAGAQQLAFNIGDVAQGFAQTGFSIQTFGRVFGQQSGQFVQAITLMRGSAGGFIGFLGGPWGAVVTGAITILTSLTAASYASADAHDAETGAAKSLEDAIHDLVKAKEEEVRTTQQSEEAALKNARAKLAEEVAVRRATVAKLQEAQAIRDAAMKGPSTDPFVDPAIAIGAGQIASNILSARVAEQTKAIAEAQRGVKLAEIPILQRQVAESTDKARAAAGQYERTLGQLNNQLAAGQINEQQYREKLTAATQARDAATKATERKKRGTDAETKAEREAAAAARQLETDLSSLLRQYDPVAAATAEYADQLERIARLQGAGKITADQADDFTDAAQLARLRAEERAEEQRRKDTLDRLGDDFKDVWDGSIVEIGGNLEEQLKRAARAGAIEFRDAGLDAANGIAAVFGWKVGRVVDLVINPAREKAAADGDPVAKGMEEIFKPIRRVFDKLTTKLDDLFGGEGKFAEALGAAGAGAQIGGVADSILDAIGVKSSKIGAQIGGAIGSAVGGPVGAIIGSIGGGLVGGLFKKTPSGSATITGVDGDPRLSGSSSTRRQAAGSLAEGVQDGLKQIAEQLGGTLGAFAVSIGIRDDKFRVDPSGRGQTKTSRGAVDFGTDQAAAVAFAIADAIKDGAVGGLSAAVQQAIRSNPDINEALAEALKVQEVETLLKGIAGTLEQAFKGVEAQAKERTRIARQYGFDLVKIEEINAKERAKVFQDVLSSRVGELQDMLNDLSFGDLFEGTLTDQRQKLLVEIARAEAEAKDGVDGAAARLADLNRRLIDVSRNANGTAGAEFASDIARARSSAEEVIRIENERVKAAQDAAIGTKAAIDENNRLTDETNALLAQQIAILRNLGLPIAAGTSGGGSREGLSTSRNVAVR